MSDNVKRIEDSAERRIREGGYRSFSFREIADEIGIKSSSVHYHFPTKQALASRVAQRYRERTLEKLGDPWQGEPVDLLARLVTVFSDALKQDGRMCLCGALGAESADLPDDVKLEIRRFFDAVLGWLETVYGRQGQNVPQSENRAKAVRLLALLEGAMLLSVTLGDRGLYEQATARIPR